MASKNIHSNVQHKLKKNSIDIKPSKEGSLHSAMGVKQDNKISTGAEERKLAAAKKSGNTSLEKKLVFAINSKRWHH